MAWHSEGPGPGHLFVRYRDIFGDDGRLTGWVATIHDITEQKRADLKLRESETFYRTFFKHGGFGIALVDPATGRRVAFNRKLHERLGYTS